MGDGQGVWVVTEGCEAFATKGVAPEAMFLGTTWCGHGYLVHGGDQGVYLQAVW